jgi:hypothetical protein
VPILVVVVVVVVPLRQTFALRQTVTVTPHDPGD